MTLSSALSNALSGLTASARGAGVISSNLSNALTDGYAARNLSLTARSGGADGGVMVTGVTRLVDLALLGDRRQADAALSRADTRAGYLERLTALTGDPTEERSLTGLMARFESALISAASLPESDTQLAGVLGAAQDLTGALNGLSVGVQSLRQKADRGIAGQVQHLNSALKKVEALNRDIIAGQAQGRDTSGLQDQRQALIDDISTAIPVQEIQRDFGTVALMAAGGRMLLDGEAAELTFAPRNTVAAHMTLENGLLSGLQINGTEVSMTSGQGLAGGALGALFALRDETLPQVQAELDTVALDLIERFETGLDASLSAGQPGLFTDAGAVAGVETGIAGRIGINAVVDPDQGGALWHLRDGLGAGQPGNVGNADLLNAMLDRLTAQRPQSGNALGTTDRDAATLASDFLSNIAGLENSIAQDQSFAAAHQGELKELELALGVDSDAELQKLILIERAYAANAKMVQAVDEMLQRLMEIG